MNIGIVLFFSRAATVQIKEIQKELVDLGISDHTYLSKIKPHLTISGAEMSEGEVARVSDGLNSLREVQKFELSMSSVGYFPYKKRVLFLNPSYSDALSEIYEAVSAILKGEGIETESLYRKENWSPHCSIASRLSKDEILAGIQQLGHRAFPIKLTVSSLGVIDCEKNVILHRIDFREQQISPNFYED
jgi:2'-5' RNA ligase